MLEIWIRSGIGGTIRHIPLHIISVRLGLIASHLLHAVHELTGSDCTWKCGT